MSKCTYCPPNLQQAPPWARGHLCTSCASGKECLERNTKERSSSPLAKLGEEWGSMPRSSMPKFMNPKEISSKFEKPMKRAYAAMKEVSEKTKYPRYAARKHAVFAGLLERPIPASPPGTNIQSTSKCVGSCAGSKCKLKSALHAHAWDTCTYEYEWKGFSIEGNLRSLIRSGGKMVLQAWADCKCKSQKEVKCLIPIDDTKQLECKSSTTLLGCGSRTNPKESDQVTYTAKYCLPGHSGLL